MDLTATCMCKENNLPIVVFDMDTIGNLKKVMLGEENDEEKGRFVRKERYSGACSRSFYVGEDITEEEIKAKFKNGTLTIVVPKKEDKKELPSKKYIEIE